MYQIAIFNHFLNTQISPLAFENLVLKKSHLMSTGIQKGGVLNIMEKLKYIYETIEKINAKRPVSQKEIIIAITYFEQLGMSGKFPGSPIEQKQIGKLLNIALQNKK